MFEARERHQRVLASVAAVALAAGIAAVGMVTTTEPAGASPDGFVQILQLGPPEGQPVACELAAIDLGPAGTLTPIGPTFTVADDGCPFDMALHAGVLYGVLTFGDGTTTSLLVTIDQTTGVRTTIGPLGFATSLAGLAFDAAGTLWLYAQSSDPACAGGTNQSCLYRVDPATGAATYVATAPRDQGVLGATATCTAVLADQFVQEENQPPVGRLVTVDTTTAALDPAPNNYSPGVLMTGIERDGAGVLHGVGFVIDGEMGPQAPSTFTIDPDTGLATHVADPGVDENQVLAALAITGLDCSTPAQAVAATVDFAG